MDKQRHANLIMEVYVLAKLT